MKLKRRKYRSCKIERYRLTNTFTAGAVVGIIGVLIFNRLPDETKREILKTIIEKAKKENE